MNFDQYFATQHKECFVYFGIPIGTSVAETDDHVCTMTGCVATLVEVDRKDGCIWSLMPQLALQLQGGEKFYNKIESVHLCGGYSCEEEIRMLGLVDGGYGNYNPKWWTTSLTVPSLHWSENNDKKRNVKILDHTKSVTTKNPQDKKRTSSKTVLIAVQKFKQYIICFYAVKSRYDKPQKFYNISIIDEEKQQSCICLVSTDSSVMISRYVNCAVVGADLFIVNGDKMAKVEKFAHLLVASAN